MKKVIHPGAKRNCALCQGLGHQIVAKGGHAVAIPCDCTAHPCPACHDIGFVSLDPSNPYAERIPCEHSKADLRAERFNAAKVPARFSQASLLTFKTTRETQEAYDAAMDILAGWGRNDSLGGLVLWGDVGRGKTHLVVGLLRELVLSRGITARFIEFSLLLADLKASFERGNSADVLDSLGSVDLLVIDELGKGRSTAFEIQVVDELVSRRYNSQGMVVATTNYGPGESTGRSTPDPVRGLDSSLVDRVGPRVEGRLREMCRFVHLGGPDLRPSVR